MLPLITFYCLKLPFFTFYCLLWPFIAATWKRSKLQNKKATKNKLNKIKKKKIWWLFAF